MVYDRRRPPNLPSDLAGITPATYEAHSSGNLTAALGAAGTQIEQIVRDIGPIRWRHDTSAEAGRKHQWIQRSLSLIVGAAGSIGATCYTGKNLMDMLPRAAWPHSFDGMLVSPNDNGGRVLITMEYDPPIFLAYEVDTVNGRFAEAASDFGAQAVLFVRPSPILDYVMERVKQFPAVWCTTIDDDTSVAGLSGELKEMLDNVKWWSDHELLTSLTTPMPRN